MKKWLLLLPLFIGCSDIKSPDVPSVKPHSAITIPEVLVIGNLDKPKPLSREELLESLFKTLSLMEEDQLPFDEPKHEVGQQDGSLRPRWEQAYLAKRGSYWFNEDKYYVYGKGKVPRPPEVCADFIVDTLERLSGTWYQDHKRVIGKLDIRSVMTEQKLYHRRVTDLVTYFKSQPENFKFVFSVEDPAFAPINYWGGPKVTPVYGADGLLDVLSALKVEVGDIIIISGKAPWDHGAEEHHHSMFVKSLDSAFVDTIVGNDAWVREKRVDIEMARAPQRRVKYIVRLTDEFLLSVK